MQTFLPYPDFIQSARVLDRKRLGKQRVETWQIWLALQRGSGAWTNHPAVKMWRGHGRTLLVYGIVMCNEWKNRGYRDSMAPRFISLFLSTSDPAAMPSWVGDERFHSSHRSNLLRKDPGHYGQFGWTDDPGDPYWWPA